MKLKLLYSLDTAVLGIPGLNHLIVLLIRGKLRDELCSFSNVLSKPALLYYCSKRHQIEHVFYYEDTPETFTESHGISIHFFYID